MERVLRGTRNPVVPKSVATPNKSTSVAVRPRKAPQRVSVSDESPISTVRLEPREIPFPDASSFQRRRNECSRGTRTQSRGRSRERSRVGAESRAEPGRIECGRRVSASGYAGTWGPEAIKESDTAHMSQRSHAPALHRHRHPPRLCADRSRCTRARLEAPSSGHVFTYP